MMLTTTRFTILALVLILFGTAVPLAAQSFIAGPGGVLAQRENGVIGGFGPVDEWGAFGKAPFPTVTGDIPYGQRTQRGQSFTLYQLSRRSSGKMDSNIFFGDNTPQLSSFPPGFEPSRLDFRYLNQDNSTGTPTLDQSAAITMIGATSKPISSTLSGLCFSIFPGPVRYCYIRMGIERTNPSYSLDVNGIIRANNVSISSDARFKRDINTIENGLSVLGNLRGTTYTMRDDADFGEGQFDFGASMESGFIAQEMEDILPHLVYTDDQGFKSVNYTGVIPYLVEGVKEVDDKTSKQIAQLQAENDELRARLEALENDRTGKSAAGAMDLKPAELFQNVPNPFDRETEIRYFLPEGSNKAEMLVFDMNGRQLMRFGIEGAGEGSITIEGSALEAGMYFYSLVSNGVEVATKRMILSK